MTLLFDCAVLSNSARLAKRDEAAQDSGGTGKPQGPWGGTKGQPHGPFAFPALARILLAVLWHMPGLLLTPFGRSVCLLLLFALG